MPPPTVTSALSEPQFAALVDAISSDPRRQEELLGLLREDHPVYDQRGAAAIVRMRGWLLLAWSCVGVTQPALLFVLEELDTGRDAYLVAAAARALRSYAHPAADFAPFVMRALANIRYHDEPVAFDHYGQYATGDTDLTPVGELLSTLAWLGLRAGGVRQELEAWRAEHSGLSRKRLAELDRTLAMMDENTAVGDPGMAACCEWPSGFGNAWSWVRGSRRSCEPIAETVFQDQEGASITFAEFFRGQPCVVVFFYTRCDNPQKCSLTIAKLARLQNLLAERGLADAVRTAAITYDPAFDTPERMRGYGKSRQVRTSPGHRLLRPTGGILALRTHFGLGVNFVESLVNRHRLEVYVLDEAGGLAASFERIHWDEERIVDCAAALLQEERPATIQVSAPGVTRARGAAAAVPFVGTLASVGLAFFPKCPLCWAAYLSLFGITSLHQMPYFSWIQPVLAALVLLNLFAVWVRSRSTRRMTAFGLVTAGACGLLLSRVLPSFEEPAAVGGIVLTLAGSLLSATQTGRKAAPFFLRAHYAAE